MSTEPNFGPFVKKGFVDLAPDGSEAWHVGDFKLEKTLASIFSRLTLDLETINTKNLTQLKGGGGRGGVSRLTCWRDR